MVHERQVGRARDSDPRGGRAIVTSPVQTEDADASAVRDGTTVSKDGTQEAKTLAGLSPGQLMWRRFKSDRTGVVSAVVVIFFFVIALLAPVIKMALRQGPVHPVRSGQS